jgi:hypothetical protein
LEDLEPAVEMDDVKGLEKRGKEDMEKDVESPKRTVH